MQIQILLATFNGGRFLRAQLDSLFSQSFSDFSLLVRDDGSTDDTLIILASYIAEHPNRIRMIQDDIKHRGATLSFAYLIEKSTAEYLMLCDQDDVWLSNKIESTFSAMKLLESEFPDKPLLVFTDLKEVDENLSILNHSFMKSQRLFPEIVSNPLKILSLNVVAGCTTLFNSKSKKFILPIPSRNIVHDQWIAVNISYFGKVKFLPISTILYRQHNANAVGANSVGLKYFLNKISKPSKQFMIYTDLISSLKFRVSYPAFVFYKIYYSIKRLTRAK